MTCERNRCSRIHQSSKKLKCMVISNQGSNGSSYWNRFFFPPTLNLNNNSWRITASYMKLTPSPLKKYSTVKQMFWFCINRQTVISYHRLKNFSIMKTIVQILRKKVVVKVSPRFELGSLDCSMINSESKVLTTTPWDRLFNIVQTYLHCALCNAPDVTSFCFVLSSFTYKLHPPVGDLPKYFQIQRVFWSYAIQMKQSIYCIELGNRRQWKIFRLWLIHLIFRTSLFLKKTVGSFGISSFRQCTSNVFLHHFCCNWSYWSDG